MRLFEAESDGRTVRDVASEAGVDKTTGGRALVSGPIISNNMVRRSSHEWPACLVCPQGWGLAWCAFRGG